MNSTSVRKELVEALKLDLIGPWDVYPIASRRVMSVSLKEWSQ
jgi:hypothetical protein